RHRRRDRRRRHKPLDGRSFHLSAGGCASGGGPASDPPRRACEREGSSAMDTKLTRRQALQIGAAGAALLAAPRAGRAQARPKSGGHLIAAQEIDPISLDNHKTSNYSSVQGVEHIVESLTQYDDKLN